MADNSVRFHDVAGPLDGAYLPPDVFGFSVVSVALS